jgi:uncharacterized protein YggT (Ycf19 family)
MKNVLRWILVLPAAIGAYVAAILVQNLILFFAGEHNDDFGVPWLLNNFREVTDIIFRTIGVYFFVIAGAAVAPRGKFATALVLTTTICVFFIGVTLFVMLSGIAQQPIAYNLAEMLLACAAASIACIQEYRKEQQNKKLSAFDDTYQP